MAKLNLTKKDIAAWRQPGPAGFWAWIDSIKPKILTKSGKYVVFNKKIATEAQIEAVEGILSPDRHMAVLCWPRRHGKSTLFCLLILHQLTTRPNWTCGLLGSSEQHSLRTQYRLIGRIIRNTPIMSDAVPDGDVLRWHLVFRPLSSTIQLQQQNQAASFGDKLDLLWVSDLHSHSDLSPYHQLQASLLDSANSQIWVDSNVDLLNGVVHNLEVESKADPGIFFHRVVYDNLEDYDDRAPVWISRQRAKRLTKTTLEADWKRDLLGKRSNLKNSLFPPEVIAKCRDTYRQPVEDVAALVGGRAYRVGGGLDRARSLFQSSTSDATVWTSIVKTTSAEFNEAEFFVLSQKKINPNLSRLIKKQILKDHQQYNFTNTALENHEVGDLAPWLSDQSIPFELVAPYAKQQNMIFIELHRICKENRLRIPANCVDLIKEMEIFQYKQGGGQSYQFGAAGSGHDDHIYSLAWAIHSVRSEVLDLYQIKNIVCASKSFHRHHCFLMGGNRVLFCAENCDPYHRVEKMFQSYKVYQMDSSLSISEFFASKVRRVGCRVRQAV